MRMLYTGILSLVALAAAPLLANAGLAEACAGLIGSNGAVNLGRTTTLAAYNDGVEHYVTAFEFQGGGGEFGTLIPLPGVPSKVERGGDWTLQRLQRETQPPRPAARQRSPRTAGADGVEVLQEVRIDALDITVLKGGAPDVAVWAKDHGFRLSPDAPEVLDFYAQRSPIFLAAVFDGEAAAERGQAARRRHAGAHHDADRQPVGAAAHPGPRQAGGRPRPGRRLPADRRQAGAAARHRTMASSSRTTRKRTTCCSTTCAPTPAWAGCPIRPG